LFKQFTYQNPSSLFPVLPQALRTKHQISGKTSLKRFMTIGQDRSDVCLRGYCFFLFFLWIYLGQKMLEPCREYQGKRMKILSLRYEINAGILIRGRRFLDGKKVFTQVVRYIIDRSVYLFE
jgi:hypothetical protein